MITVPLVLLFLAAGTGLYLMNRSITLRAGYPYLVSAALTPPLPEETFSVWMRTIEGGLAQALGTDAYELHFENRSVKQSLFSAPVTVTMVWFKFVPGQDMEMRRGRVLLKSGDFSLTFIDAVQVG